MRAPALVYMCAYVCVCWYVLCAAGISCALVYMQRPCAFVCVCACMRDCVGARVYIGWAGRALRHGGATCPCKREWLMPGTRYIPAESSWRHDEFMKSTPMARHIRILCECVVAATLACLLLAPLSPPILVADTHACNPDLQRPSAAQYVLRVCVVAC